MKILINIFAGMAAMSVVACSEDALETSPSSSVSGNELLGTATNALVSLNGVYRAMYTAGVSNSSNTHQCFGITAYNLVADVMGEDCIMNGQGSGWFWYDCVYNVNQDIPLPDGVLMICGMAITLGFLMSITFGRRGNHVWK